MRSKWIFVLIAVVAVFSLVLSACQPAATVEPTQATGGEATQAPVATQAPEVTQPPAAGGEVKFPDLTEKPFEAVVYSATDCEYGGLIKSIEAVDELTVKFTMCVPDPAFPAKAAFSPFSIQPREWLEAGMENKAILAQPIGTGPYMIQAWNRGDSIIMKRFDDYWGEKAKTATLVFRWATEGAARKTELESGTVDGFDNPSPDDFESIANNPDLQLIDRDPLNIFYVGMTNTFPPFDKKEVRQAIAMGIDRQRIVDNFYPPASKVATHFTPCAIPNACVGDDWYEFDPVKAKELLAQAGFPDGFKTKITYRDVFRSYLPEPGLVATDLQAQLKENLNIDAEIEVMETGAYIDATSQGRVEGLHLLGWNADYPQVTNFLDYHFGKSQKQFGNAYPEIYDLLQQGAQIADPAEAESIYVKANNAIKDLVPMVPIANGGSAVAYRADVQNAHASPLGNEYFAPMVPGDRDQFVFMQGAEPISLYCADETDGESLRPCEQVLESLLSFKVGGTDVQPGLATECTSNAELTEWTCKLRSGVKFHNGFTLDARDVVESWDVAWDAANPLHIGNTGSFEYFSTLWGALLNVPAE